ncbi:MAG: helix-turn-helix domain-containing protein [Carbonactinosporaceae bacterium]
MVDVGRTRAETEAVTRAGPDLDPPAGGHGLPSLRSWMSAVADISRAVNAAEPLSCLLGRVTEQACSLIGFQFCAVMLADDKGEQLLAEGWHALSADYVRHINTDRPLLVHPGSPEMDAPSARAYRKGVTVAVTDVTTAEQFGPWRDLALEQGYHALLAAPLRTGGASAGVLVAYSAVARQFSRAEVELVELLAEQAAVALQTARLRGAEQDVIERLSVANAELRRQGTALEWAEQQHRRLMRVVLDDVGLAGVVQSLASALHASVTVEDTECKPLAAASADRYVAPPPPATRRKRWVRTALDVLEQRFEVARVMLGDTEAWVAPVVLGGQLVARLWVVNPRIAPDAVERRGIERFALVVALELLKQRHAVEVELRLSRDLLTDLLRGEGLADRESLLDRAAALGHDLNLPHTLLLVCENPGDRGGSWQPDQLLRASRLAETALAGIQGSAGRPLVGVRGEAVVLLLPCPAGARDGLRGVARRVQCHVGRLVTPHTVSVIIGATVTDPEEYAPAYRIARCAEELAREGRPGRVVDVHELGVHALLLETGTPEGLRAFADRMLAPIEEHDGRRDSGLLLTLWTWLRHECSRPATARSLVVHPNTVAYRLGRVEQLLGRSLKRPDTLLELQLALAVREVEGGQRRSFG